MKSSEIREKYLKFFEKRGHAVIPSASLLPENDASSLFTTAGMQPLVPYLLGTKHPLGTRLVDVQKCVRTGDIEDVGDNRHLTFFEMMGNWSLGDYFKKDAILWSLEFLTSKEEGLGLDPMRLYVTTFKGENGIPKDEDSINFWKENFAKHNIKAEVSLDEMINGNSSDSRAGIRIIPLGVKDNFWIAGEVGPCGGDTEMFYDVRPESGKLEGRFSDLVNSGRIIEIWNNVFMEFNKTADGKYLPLEKKNVDTGMGLERTSVVMQGKDNVFETDIFEPLISKIQSLGGRTSKSDLEVRPPSVESIRAERIVADHIKASVFMISDGVIPSNTEAGYVLRRLLRRMLRYGKTLGLKNEDYISLVEIIEWQFGDVYSNIRTNLQAIKNEIEKEIKKFSETLEKGLKEFEKGVDAFDLFQSYGFPIEMTLELAMEEGRKIDMDEFNEKMKKHQEISKAGSEQKFKGGLASTGEMETKYHTATHLLLASLQKVLKAPITQKGSNITAERMRFDFNWSEKVPSDKLKEIEDMVNEKIKEGMEVTMVELPKEEAKKVVTVLSFDESKYGDVVKVYKVGNFSAEFCGGPHVANTSELGHFKIVKEEASSAGIRRIKAVLE